MPHDLMLTLLAWAFPYLLAATIMVLVLIENWARTQVVMWLRRAREKQRIQLPTIQPLDDKEHPVRWT